jgi:hypothetical protein
VFFCADYKRGDEFVPIHFDIFTHFLKTCTFPKFLFSVVNSLVNCNGAEQ